MDLATIEQPDELIQVAWNSGFDKKVVIREGTDAAMLLLAGERNNLATLFWPVPRPLEAVNRWSENSRPATGTSEALRPFASAVVPGCVIGYIVTRLAGGGPTPLVWIIVASILVLGFLFKVLIDAAVRRQVAKLDEESALAIVLDALRIGANRNAALVPRACVWIRRGLARPAPG